ncbi:MAG: HNH endonuclease [Bacteroidota bacterium]
MSNYGRVKSIDKATQAEKLLKGTKLPTGHIRINIRLRDNSNEGIYIHRFVAEHFLKDRREDQKFIIHRDGNKNNNFFMNLRWVSQRELTDSQMEQGVYDMENRKKGPNVKMTYTKVQLLKKWLREGKTKRKVLANRMGITMTQLKRIENGENWSYVKEATE